jgi:diguanylate cyclase (GGDEF)-like protein
MMGKLDNTKRMRLLERIDSLLGSSYDLRRVIRKLYKEISKVVDTSNFYIAIYNRKENTIAFEVYTIEGKEVNALPRKLTSGLTEYVIKVKKPVRIDKSITNFCRRLKIKPIGKNARSWLGVPMIYKNSVEGVMTIQDYNKSHAYTDEIESLLTSIATRAAVVIANTRLIEDEIKRAKELSMLNQIAHRITKSLDIGNICESVTKSILQNFNNYNVAIFLIKGSDVVLKKLSKGFRDKVPRDLVMKMGEGIVGTVAKKGRSIIVDDVSTNALYRAYGQTCTKSEAAIPLKISQKTIGVLNIESDEVNAFDDNSVRILELIADRLSVALHNARLYEEATSNAKELAVSFTIAQSLTSTLELDNVLDRILLTIRETFGYANIAIFLIDRTTNELYIQASHGYHLNADKMRLRVGKEGVCGHVAAKGEMMYVPDVSKVPFYVIGKKSVKSEAALPLKIRGEVIGVLDIESDKLSAFSERDLRMFSIFASQAAVAIENARLYIETKELSLTDSLTKTANRRHFDLVLESELKKARGYSRTLSLAMIDLDGFKHFNDEHGHLVGDKMLIHIAKLLQGNVRDTDFVARYGGEEFVIIFPETSNQAAFRVSERVRTAVEERPLVIKKKSYKNMTISIGVAAYPSNASNTIELIQKADQALYKAKKRGKNRVEVCDHYV